MHLIPESTKIVYNDTPSWIYFSTDSMLCHNCQQSGHTAKICPKDAYSSQITTHTHQTKTNTQDMEIHEEHSLNFPELPIKSTDSAIIDNSSLLKRPPPPSTISEKSGTSTSSKNTEHNANKIVQKEAKNDNSFAKPLAKKKRRNEEVVVSITQQGSKQLAESLTLDKNAIDEAPTQYPLTHDQLRSFLEESYEKSNITQIAKKFSDVNTDIITMLDLTYTLTKDQSLKSRCARLKKKLSDPSNSRDSSDNESLLSEESEELYRPIK